MLKGLLITLAAVAALVLAASYVCFYIAFYVPEKNKKPKADGCFYPTTCGKIFSMFLLFLIQ